MLVRDSWAQVYLGKRKIGTSPLDRKLPVGRHRLHLVNPEIPLERDIWVTIKTGKTSRVMTTLRH